MSQPPNTNNIMPTQGQTSDTLPTRPQFISAPATHLDHVLNMAYVMLTQLKPAATNEAAQNVIKTQRQLVKDLEQAQANQRSQIFSQAATSMPTTTLAENVTNTFGVSFNDKMKTPNPPTYKGDQTLDVAESWIMDAEATIVLPGNGGNFSV